MNTRPLLLATAVVVTLQLVLSGIAWSQLPAGAQVAIHWDIDGRPNGYADAWIALLLTPAMTIVLGPVLAVIPRFDPRRENLARSAAAYLWITGSLIVLLGGVHLLVVLAALDVLVDPTRALGIGIGVLFVVIGNFLGKTRSSWFMGIRTPWTLSSDLSWARTHRLGAYLFMAVGLISALAAFLFPPAVFFWVLMIGLGGAAIVLVVYSYLVWRDDPDRRTL